MTQFFLKKVWFNFFLNNVLPLIYFSGWVLTSELLLIIQSETALSVDNTCE